MAFQDRTLACSDCGQNFIFKAGEQEFFQQRGFSNTPKRCEDCRSKRKAESKGGEARQESIQKSTRLRFPATCSRCQAQFDAPFEPKEGRPIFCRNCFAASGSR